MTFNIFHQVGHNSNWNIDSVEEDNAGDGLIFSPVHQNKNALEKINKKINQKSFFDPQYYLPDSGKKKLNTYDFFPESISQGFNTVEFSQLAKESATRCIAFQLSQEYSRIIVPTRYFREMITDYQVKQEAYSVKPFLEELSCIKNHPPIFLTLPLTSPMVRDSGYRTELLNWVTSYPEIQGVYVFIVDDRETKQIHDEDQLFGNLTFFQELRNAELDVVIGYSNTESLLYTAVDSCSISMGSFENTRMFSIEKFMVSDESRRGPKARIYLPGLLNWVLYSEAKDIKQRFPDIWQRLYVPTPYGDRALDLLVEPTFNQPDLYKHHFINLYGQASELRNVIDISQRITLLDSMIRNASTYYEMLDSTGISLNNHSLGKHLSGWSSALKRFSTTSE